MRSVFQSFDKDGNGEIDHSELKTAFQEMGKYFSDAEIQRMIELMDTDKSGTVSYEEFIAKCFGPNALL